MKLVSPIIWLMWLTQLMHSSPMMQLMLVWPMLAQPAPTMWLMWTMQLMPLPTILQPMLAQPDVDSATDVHDAVAAHISDCRESEAALLLPCGNGHGGSPTSTEPV